MVDPCNNGDPSGRIGNEVDVVDPGNTGDPTFVKIRTQIEKTSELDSRMQLALDL